MTYFTGDERCRAEEPGLPRLNVRRSEKDLAPSSHDALTIAALFPTLTQTSMEIGFPQAGIAPLLIQLVYFAAIFAHVVLAVKGVLLVPKWHGTGVRVVLLAINFLVPLLRPLLIRRFYDDLKRRSSPKV